MKERHFRISHLFLFLFLLAGCALLGYLVYNAIHAALMFHWSYLLFLVIILPAFVFCCFSAYIQLKQLAHEIKTGESPSYYEDNKN